jgi:Leucine rich repeat
MINTKQNIDSIIFLIKNSLSPRDIDGRYIPYQVQAIVDKALEGTSFDELLGLLWDPLAADKEYIINALARCLVYVHEGRAQRIVNQQSEEVPLLMHIYLRKHLTLKDAGILKEYSIADALHERSSIIEFRHGRVLLINCDVDCAERTIITSLYGIHHVDIMVPFSSITEFSLMSDFLDYDCDPDFPSKPFEKFSSLKSLGVCSRMLGTLPSDFFDGLSNLEILSFGYSPISLPDIGFSLDILAEKLYERKELSLPGTIFRSTPHLKDLTISRLAHIDPGLFKNLFKLRRLILENNTFSSLPDGVFSDLHDLTDLTLAANPYLESLPSDLFKTTSKLQSIDLAYNRLKKLPATIFNGLQELHELLNLDGNQLESLPLHLFDDCIKLQHIQLGSNNLRSILPGVFNNLPALRYIILVYNPLDTVSVDCFNTLPALVELQMTQLTDQQMADFQQKLAQEPQMTAFKQALAYKQQRMKEMQ